MISTNVKTNLNVNVHNQKQKQEKKNTYFDASVVVGI